LIDVCTEHFDKTSHRASHYWGSVIIKSKFFKVTPNKDTRRIFYKRFGPAVASSNDDLIFKVIGDFMLGFEAGAIGSSDMRLLGAVS
jgi:hypothetical protein